MSLLKGNFTNQDLLTETELNRATLEGLLARLNHGLTLLPAATPSRPMLLSMPKRLMVISVICAWVR